METNEIAAAIAPLAANPAPAVVLAAVKLRSGRTRKYEIAVDLSALEVNAVGGFTKRGSYVHINKHGQLAVYGKRMAPPQLFNASEIVAFEIVELHKVA